MDLPHFNIEHDLKQKLLRITMAGFWDDATLSAYAAELERVVNLMEHAGCARQDLLALTDTRSLSVQSQTLIAAFKERFDTVERRPRRLATLVSSALFKRQVERIAIANQRIFTDEGEALAWLFSIQDPAVGRTGVDS